MKKRFSKNTKLIFCTIIILLICMVSVNVGMNSVTGQFTWRPSFRWFRRATPIDDVVTVTPTTKPITIVPIKPTIACKDTDGDDSFTKNYVDYNNNKYEDYCVKKVGIRTGRSFLSRFRIISSYSKVPSCTGNDCYVNEYICSNDKVSYKRIKCENGCKDGACLKTTQIEKTIPEAKCFSIDSKYGCNPVWSWNFNKIKTDKITFHSFSQGRDITFVYMDITYKKGIKRRNINKIARIYHPFTINLGSVYEDITKITVNGYVDSKKHPRAMGGIKVTTPESFKTLIIELAPDNTQYGYLYLCYNSIVGYYLSRDEQYCDNQIEKHNFLEILNNPQKQFNFPDLNENFKIHNPHSLYYINDWLDKEAKRFGTSITPQFDITIKGPYTLNELPPKTTTDYYRVGPFFDQKIKELNIDTSGYDFIVVVYMDDSMQSGIDRHHFVNHAGERIYISAQTPRVMGDFYPNILIHELLHKFGAGERYVLGGYYPWCHLLSCCTEDGIAEPNKIPKYPQTKACIMCSNGNIVIEYGKEEQQAGNLDYIQICDKTAQEIGWK